MQVASGCGPVLTMAPARRSSSSEVRCNSSGGNCSRAILALWSRAAWYASINLRLVSVRESRNERRSSCGEILRNSRRRTSLSTALPAAPQVTPRKAAASPMVNTSVWATRYSSLSCEKVRLSPDTSHKTVRSITSRTDHANTRALLRNWLLKSAVMVLGSARLSTGCIATPPGCECLTNSKLDLVNSSRKTVSRDAYLKLRKADRDRDFMILHRRLPKVWGTGGLAPAVLVNKASGGTAAAANLLPEIPYRPAANPDFTTLGLPLWRSRWKNLQARSSHQFGAARDGIRFQHAQAKGAESTLQAGDGPVPATALDDVTSQGGEQHLRGGGSFRAEEGIV